MKSHAPAPKGAVCAVPAHRCSHEDPVQYHAVFGKDASGHYVGPVVLVLFCEPEDHQRGVHFLLDREHLGGRREPTLGVLLGRLGCAFAWLGWDRKGAVVLPAEVFAEVGCWLIERSRELREEGW